jgi:hypothetical protein
LAGDNAPDAGGRVVVDLDGVLVIAHSGKEDAAATGKKTYGHHPLTAFADHGPGGTGEPVAALLRTGNAGSNTAADHITTAQLALAQLPKRYRRERRTLIRTDCGHTGRSGQSMAGTAQSDRARRSSMPLAHVTSPVVSSSAPGCCLRSLLSPSWQGGGKVFGLEDVLRCARTGGGRPGQYLCQVAAYPVGFTTDLDGDVAAFGDEAVVDGSLSEHGGTVSLQQAAGRTIAAYGLRAHDRPRQAAAVFAVP